MHRMQGVHNNVKKKKKKSSYDWVNVLCELPQSHDKKKEKQRERETQLKEDASGSRHLVIEPQKSLPLETMIS